MSEITEAEVTEARESEEAFERFLTENKRHIRYRIYRTTHRVVTEDDDEWSVAVLAFWEAVKNYDESKGKFIPFADTVITRRLIDSIRENARHGQEIPVDIDETLSGVAAEDRVEDEREFEVAALSERLRVYGIEFRDLISCSPKSEKTRRACAAAVSAIMDDEEIFGALRKTGELPIKKVAEISGASRKTIERHRKYIIAATEILKDDYPELSEYMRYITEWRKNNESHSS